MEGCSPWGHKELDVTECLSMNVCNTEIRCKGGCCSYNLSLHCLFSSQGVDVASVSVISIKNLTFYQEAKQYTVIEILICNLVAQKMSPMFLASEVKDAQSCPTLCDHMDYTVHGILQTRILQWVAFPFFRGSSQPRDRNQVSHIAGRFFTS